MPGFRLSPVDQDGHIDSRVSRSEALANRLESEILTEKLPQGTRLGTKQDLRARFGVAVATITEAIRMLEMKGLIEARPGPGGGVFVAAPSAGIRFSHLILKVTDQGELVSEALEVRNELEPLLCEQARARCTDADAADLRIILADMAAALDDPGRFLRSNWALHCRIAEIAGNSILKSVYLALLDVADTRLQQVTPDRVFNANKNLARHVELVEAIISGDAKRVAKAVRTHRPRAVA